jgi:hypothetical protein
MAEPGNRVVEAARPGHERVDLARREQLGVDIDDPPGKKGEHLTALLVEPQHPRSVLGTWGKEIQKGMNRSCPRTRRPMHRAANPPCATQIPGQPHRLPRAASLGIVHVSSIGYRRSRQATILPLRKRLQSPIALQPPGLATFRSCCGEARVSNRRGLLRGA